MRFSLRLNNDLRLPDYVALAQAAEGAGFHQLWVSHDLFWRSAPVILAAVAGATTRLEIGTGILNPYTLHPAEIAMLAATMDELSGNRFNLGLAAGAADFLEWVGIEQLSPLTAMAETVHAVRGLLRGESMAMDGRFLHWRKEATLRFDPPRATPIYLGATGPHMLALAGQVGDGVLPLLFPPEHYFAVLPHIAAGQARRRPDLGSLDLAACIWVSLSENPAAARRLLAHKIAYYGHALSPMILASLGLSRTDFEPIQRALLVERDEGKAIGMVTESMLRIGVVGGPGAVIDRLEPLVQAGARHLSFGPPLGPDPLQAVMLLAEVVAYFRS